MPPDEAELVTNATRATWLVLNEIVIAGLDIGYLESGSITRRSDQGRNVSSHGYSGSMPVMQHYLNKSSRRYQLSQRPG